MADDNEPKNMDDMKKFAEDLANRMKQQVDDDAFEGEFANLLEEAQDESDRVPPEREELLRTLENDVDALGWDQPAKLWGVLIDEDTGDEYLKLVTTLKGYAPDAIMKIAKKGRAKENIKGVVIAVEAWSYPDVVMDALNGDHDSFQALFRLLPPSDHPERVSRRMVSMFNRDGTYACITRRQGAEEPQLMAAIDPSLTPAIAALLGMAPKKHKHKHKHHHVHNHNVKDLFSKIKSLAEVVKVMEQIQEEMETTVDKDGIKEDEYTRRLFQALPAEVRKDIMATMPDHLRNELFGEQFVDYDDDDD